MQRSHNLDTIADNDYKHVTCYIEKVCLGEDINESNGTEEDELLYTYWTNLKWGFGTAVLCRIYRKLKQTEKSGDTNVTVDTFVSQNVLKNVTKTNLKDIPETEQASEEISGTILSDLLKGYNSDSDASSAVTDNAMLVDNSITNKTTRETHAPVTENEVLETNLKDPPETNKTTGEDNSKKSNNSNMTTQTIVKETIQEQIPHQSSHLDDNVCNENEVLETNLKDPPETNEMTREKNAVNDNAMLVDNSITNSTTRETPASVTENEVDPPETTKTTGENNSKKSNNSNMSTQTIVKETIQEQVPDQSTHLDDNVCNDNVIANIEVLEKNAGDDSSVTTVLKSTQTSMRKSSSSSLTRLPDNATDINTSKAKTSQEIISLIESDSPSSYVSSTSGDSDDEINLQQLTNKHQKMKPKNSEKKQTTKINDDGEKMFDMSDGEQEQNLSNRKTRGSQRIQKRSATKKTDKKHQEKGRKKHTGTTVGKNKARRQQDVNVNTEKKKKKKKVSKKDDVDDDQFSVETYDPLIHTHLPRGEMSNFAKPKIRCEEVDPGRSAYLKMPELRKSHYIDYSNGYEHLACFIERSFDKDVDLLESIKPKPPRGEDLIACECTWAAGPQRCFLNDTYVDLPKNLGKILKKLKMKKKRCLAAKCALGWRCELALGYNPLSIYIEGSNELIYSRN